MMKYFKRNLHVSIRDTEDILRMFYHIFEKLALKISKNEKYGNFYTLKLK